MLVHNQGTPPSSAAEEVSDHIATTAIQRWLASALVEAEKYFRRVRGYRELQHLVNALDAMAPPAKVIADVA